ncbi:MAG: hypothetical protein HAW64_03760 [Alphaproteobacteria bacterium]|nr:hypothetical protein [Alphaproteobacteria bacterium]
MSIFITTLQSKEEEIGSKISTSYEGSYYRLPDTSVYLISTADFSEEICEKIGLKGEDRIEGALGAVFKMNSSYAGYSTQNLWDWIERASGE